MKIEKLNFKVGQKYILPEIFKRIENNYLVRKQVTFNTIDKGVILEIYVSYKEADSMFVTCKSQKGIVEILDIQLA